MKSGSGSGSSPGSSAGSGYNAPAGGPPTAS
jgi:hypothetical protein